MTPQERNLFGELLKAFIHRNDPLLTLDIFLRDGLSYEALLPDAVEMDYGDGVLRVLSAEKLLTLKRAIQPPRSKDVLDIAELERLRKEADDA